MADSRTRRLHENAMHENAMRRLARHHVSTHRRELHMMPRRETKDASGNLKPNTKREYYKCCCNSYFICYCKMQLFV